MAEIKRILFIGMYPNNVNKYRNVFFQNLIFAMADAGIECTVISPVPITKYRKSTKLIPKQTYHYTNKKSKVEVYYPRYISASSKQIGSFNTEKISEFLFENSVMGIVKSLKEKYDCVYGHFFLYGGLAAVKAGRYLRLPSYIAYGECDFNTEVKNTYGIPKPKSIEGLSGIISVSTKNTQALERLGFTGDIPVITVPNAADLSIFGRMDKKICRNKLGIPQDKFVVGFVGGFIERKGDDRLMEAVNRIDEAYVAFAGTGDRAHSGDKVVFCDKLEHNDVPVLLNAIDVFALPTLAEGSCNAIVEALACGCPVISSDLPFNHDVLNKENSIMIDPMNIDEIEQAIRDLKDDSERRRRLADEAFKIAEELSIEKRAEKILKFMEDSVK